MGLELRKIDRETINRKFAAILGTTHLTPLADRYPGELSAASSSALRLRAR